MESIKNDGICQCSNQSAKSLTFHAAEIFRNLNMKAAFKARIDCEEVNMPQVSI
jgi:hypothetical protein